MARDSEQPGFEEERAEEFATDDREERREEPELDAAIQAALEDPRPLRIVLMGPARAGKTLLLWSWKEIVGQFIAGQRVRPTEQFNAYVREIDESLRGAVSEVDEDSDGATDDSKKAAVESVVDRRLQGQRTATDSAPPDLVLFEIVPGLKVRTRDWAGEQLEARELYGDGAEEVQSALAKSLEQADALLLVVDAFTGENAEFQAFVQDHLQFLAQFAAGEHELAAAQPWATPRPLAVVTTKFDHSPEFEELIRLAEEQQSGRLVLDADMRELAETAVENWVYNVLQEPGEEVPLLGTLKDLNAQYFPCSAFGRNPSRRLRPALTLAPLRYVIEQTLRRRGGEILERRASAKQRLLAAQARRRAFWVRVHELTWASVALVVCLALAAVVVPLWQVSSHLRSGQVAEAREAEWRHVGVLAEPWSPLSAVEAGHLQLLTWGSIQDRALDDAAAEQVARAYFERLCRHAGATPWTRQAALAMALGPTRRARDNGTNITPAAALQLESALVARMSKADVAAHLDSWARRRIGEERVELLLAALPSREAVTRLEALLRRDREPLRVAVTDKIFVALARRDLAQLGDWSGVETVLRRFDQYAGWAIHAISDRAVVELSHVAVKGLEGLAPQALEQALNALAAAAGKFSARFAVELHDALVAGSFDRLKAAFVGYQGPAMSGRMATLFGHAWLRDALRGRDRELFAVAARAAFGGRQQTDLLDRVATLALDFAPRAGLVVAGAETLTDADYALLFGVRGDSARRSYFDRYEELLAGRSAKEHANGLARCLHVMNLVKRHAPIPRLDEELLDQVDGRQRKVGAQLAEQAIAQIVAGKSVDMDLLVRVLADQPSKARQRLEVAVVENAPALPAKLFEDIATGVALHSPRTSTQRLLRVAVWLGARRQPASDEARIARANELLWALAYRSDVVELSAAMKRRAMARVREHVGRLVRGASVSPAHFDLFARCAAFRADDPGLLLAPRDRSAVADHLWPEAVLRIGKQPSAAVGAVLVSRLRMAAALDPAGSKRRVEELAPVLERVEAEPGLRTWLLEIAPALRRHDADVAAAIGRAAAPALELEAIDQLTGRRRPTAARIDRAAKLLERAARLAPESADRRVGIIRLAVAAADIKPALRQALYGLLRRGPEAAVAKALRSGLAPLFESSALEEIAAARIGQAIAAFEEAVVIEPAGETRRAERFAKAVASRARDPGYLQDVHAFGRRAQAIEAATARAVETSVASAALENIRDCFRSGRLAAIRGLCELMPVGARRSAVLAHLQRLNGSALVDLGGSRSFYCSVDLVTYSDYKRWVDGLPAQQRRRHAVYGLPHKGVAVGMRWHSAVAYAKSKGGILPTYAQLQAARRVASGPWQQLRGDFHQWVYCSAFYYAPYARTADKKTFGGTGKTPGLVAIRVVYPVIPKELR